MALVRGDLHKALLAVGADDVGVAGGLLHGDGGEENGGDIVRAGGLVEGVDEGSAGAVGVARLGEDIVEVLRDHRASGEEGWSPATILDATVEPVDGTIGTARSGGVGCGGGSGEEEEDKLEG